MKTVMVIALTLVLLPTLAFAQKKDKKPSLPVVFNEARLVYVEAAGGEEFKPGLPVEDRMAIADVRDALHAWGRYTFTSEREKADLVFVVHKGRPGTGELGGANNGPDAGGLGQMGGGRPGMGGTTMDGPGAQGSQFPGQQRQRGNAAGVGGEASLEDDVLEVCQLKANGKRTGAFWVHSMQNGLNPPRLLLFTQLREAVEKAYPKAPDTPQAKP